MRSGDDIGGESAPDIASDNSDGGGPMKVIRINTNIVAAGATDGNIEAAMGGIGGPNIVDLSQVPINAKNGIYYDSFGNIIHVEDISAQIAPASPNNASQGSGSLG